MILFFFFVPREKRRPTFFVAYSYVHTKPFIHHLSFSGLWLVTCFFKQWCIIWFNISVVLLIQQPLWTSPKMLITIKKSQVVLLRSYNKMNTPISLSLSLSLSLFLSLYMIYMYTHKFCVNKKIKESLLKKNKRKNIQHNKNHIISWGMIA